MNFSGILFLALFYSHRKPFHQSQRPPNMSDPAQLKSSKRLSAETEEPSRKKAKKEEAGEKYNPYLAHMYQPDGEQSNGVKAHEPPPDSPLAGMKRRTTTAKQAAKAEDSDSNPFTGAPHSQKYFQILEGRRNLPVHKQRYVPHDLLWSKLIC